MYRSNKAIDRQQDQIKGRKDCRRWRARCRKRNCPRYRPRDQWRDHHRRILKVYGEALMVRVQIPAQLIAEQDRQRLIAGDHAGNHRGQQHGGKATGSAGYRG